MRTNGPDGRPDPAPALVPTPAWLGDPFAGYGPQTVRCRWLSRADEERADSARIVRLVVDANRWSMHWVNLTYQRQALQEIAGFLSPTRAVICTPAGMITTEVGWLGAGPSSLPAALIAVDGALSCVDLGRSPPEILLGIDGCVPGQATPLQALVHLSDNLTAATTANTTLKLYPNSGERDSLLGWLATEVAGEVPMELAQARRAMTAVGSFLAAVCQDACLFSARSLANLENQTGIRIRNHFVESATATPRPEFALIATHYQEDRSGNVFKNAAARLAKMTGSTVVTTMFAPQDELEAMAWAFPIHGPCADEVVTLLVEDTLENQ